MNDIYEEINELKTKPFHFSAIYKIATVFRWVINIFIFGIPWLIISFLLMAYNIVINSWINKGWAYGNFWLLGNTFFVIF